MLMRHPAKWIADDGSAGSLCQVVLMKPTSIEEEGSERSGATPLGLTAAASPEDLEPNSKGSRSTAVIDIVRNLARGLLSLLI
jgi:hypothetical protein